MSEVKFLASVADEAAECAFETLGHGCFPFGRRTECRHESIMQKAAGATKASCYIDDMSASRWYSDQILPFDITLAGTNEMGAASTMKIFGVEILNEGSGVSIDDAVTEMQATFVARYVEPWTAVKGPDFGIGVGGDSISTFNAQN